MEPAVSPAKAYGVSPHGVGGSWGKAMRLQGPVGPSPPATPGSCPLAWKRQSLQRNTWQDEKLQRLKARIQQQQQEWCVLRALREHRMLALNSAESPTHLRPHPKRKVCKMAFVSSPPVHAGRRGKVAKKTQDGPSATALQEKAQKERVAHSVRASSWREGQKLAMEILGPRPKYPKPSRRSEQNIGHVPPGPKRYGMTREARPSHRDNELALKSGREQDHQGREGNGTLMDKESPQRPRNRSTRAQSKLTAEKKMSSSPETMGSVENGCTQRRPGGAPGFRSASAHLTDARDPLEVWMRPSERGQMAGKENQPSSHTKARGRRRSLSSPEQIHEFMAKKSAERKKRSREERLATQQAQEAKDTRLQEVFRKQKEALGRRKSHAEVPRGTGAVRSATPTRDIGALERAGEKRPKSERTGWLNRASQALLRSETHLQRSTEGTTTTTHSPAVASYCSTLESFPPPKELVVGFQEWSPQQNPTLCPSQTKQERIRALWLLAQDLSERLDREMGVANGSVDLERKGEMSGGPTASEPCPGTQEPAMPPVEPGAARDGDAIWDSSRSQNPPRGARKTQEKVAVCRDGLAAYTNAGQPRLLTSSFGCAVSDRLQRDKNPSQGDARPGVLRATPQFPPGRQSIRSQIKHYTVSHPHPGLQVDDVKNCFGLLLGQAGHVLSQPQICGRSSPSVLPPHSSGTITTEEPADASEPTDSTSQWSEIGHFYGSSRTFAHFGLSMVEQSLREEELHARHRMALLRLREKALQEKAQAELAWLEHETSSQKSSGDGEATLAFLEKQSTLLTELKQEQAEIRHLQNLCQAAHQGRKLLLKQQKELLRLQQATAQLWNQLSAQSGKPLQEMLDSHHGGTNDAPHWGRSREGSGCIPQQGGQKDRHNLLRFHLDGLLVEIQKRSVPLRPVAVRRDISLQGVQTEQELCKRKPQLGAQSLETLEGRARNWSSSRNQPAVGGTAGSNLEEDCEGEDAGLRNGSKGDLHSPAHEEVGHWAAAAPCAERRSFSPYRENPCLDSEFQKARAVLINLSGSSRPPSDAEAEDGQDTDVSLPEEFVFQDEELDHSSGRLADPPAMPETAAGSRDAMPPDSACPTALFGGYSAHGHASIPCLEQKTLEDPPDEERIEDGQLVLASVSASGRNPSSSLACNPEPCGERQGPEEAAAQGDVEPAAASPSGDASWQGLEGAALGTAEGPWGGGENAPRLEERSVTHAPEAFSESVEPTQRTCPRDNRQPTPSLSPNPLATHLGLEGRADTAEGPPTSREYSVPLRCPRVPEEEDSTGVVLRCPDSAGRRTQGSEKSSPQNAQGTEESGMDAHHPSSPEAGQIFPAQICSLGSRDTTILPRTVLLYDLEEKIVSPVDEVLSYGSAGLSSTEREASFPMTELPPPPRDLSGSDHDSHFSCQDFPTPPADGLLSEARARPYALEEEDLSAETNILPPSGNLPPPLPASAGVCPSSQGSGRGP